MAEPDLHEAPPPRAPLIVRLQTARAGSAGPFAHLLVFAPPGGLGTIRASGSSKVEMRHGAPLRSARLSAAAVLLLVAIMGCDGASKVTSKEAADLPENGTVEQMGRDAAIYGAVVKQL